MQWITHPLGAPIDGVYTCTICGQSFAQESAADGFLYVCIDDGTIHSSSIAVAGADLVSPCTVVI